MTQKSIRISLVLAAVTMPFFIFSYAFADTQGQSVNFNINNNFDKFGRTNTTATLRYIGGNAYFYIEDAYWNTLDAIQRENFVSGIEQLSNEFDSTVYPKETMFWGQEPKPGVDRDNRITILLEQLKNSHGGYFSTVNGYPKEAASGSNEREMMVINVETVGGQYVKNFLAHEFHHLISFNQKELLRNINEEVWLNELRAEYSTTLVGYNNVFSGSNLERRVETFFSNPSDSLTEWPNVSLDYSLAMLLAEYVAEEHGRDILKESLQSGKFGIPSIDSTLAARGIKERFKDIFINWVIASYVNDESKDAKFGYSRPELKNRKAVLQRVTILPQSGSSAFDYFLKPWQPYGHKFYINGLSADKTIKLTPSSNAMTFAYFDNLGRFGTLNGNFYITNPGGLEHFFIFPVNATKITGFGSSENESSASLTVSFEEKTLGVEFGSALKNGVLIKKARESEIYVIEGKYKRYLRPEIIALYGHLDPVKAIEVDDTTFNSYTTSNYIKYVNDEKVYAVWPDGTKHWLNITAQQWDASGRDWNSIFVINELELNTYKNGPNITR